MAPKLAASPLRRWAADVQFASQRERASRSITKQSLGRVLNDLAERALVESRPGPVDRRQKLLRLTKAGVALEARLFSSLRDKMAHAYDNAGEAAVTGFWHVLEGLIPESELDRVIALQRGP